MIFGNFRSDGEKLEFVVVILGDIRHFWVLAKLIQNQRFSSYCKAGYNWVLEYLCDVIVFYHNL